MDKQRAMNVLLANACCTDNKLTCDMCPWNDAEDCKSTNFNDVLYEAFQIINGGISNEKNEVK